MDEKEPFLSRWSRRKLAAKEDAPAAAPQAPIAPNAAAAPPLVPAADSPEEELQASGTPEYRQFFDPKVDEAQRLAALKTLFNEPQFNVMDGLDTYIDDYSRPDPSPEAMLRQMNQAKDLFLFDEEKKPDGGASNGTVAAGDLSPGSPAASAEIGTPANPATSDVPGADAALGGTAAPPLAGRSSE